MRGIPDIVWILGAIVAVVVLIAWITGKPPGITGSLGVTASTSSPLTQPNSPVLV